MKWDSATVVSIKANVGELELLFGCSDLDWEGIDFPSHSVTPRAKQAALGFTPSPWTTAGLSLREDLFGIPKHGRLG